MNTAIRLMVLILISGTSHAQSWKICNSPAFATRVDDIFMVNTQTGYAVCGDGKIVKTTDEGENWVLLEQSNNIYYRSVEFMNTQKGFVGGFSFNPNMTSNILRRTTDGGATWTDLSPLLHPRARRGICGLAVADSNTIYGGGNWFGDSAYIVKSHDGGNTWSFLDMSAYASSIIDMHFLNKAVGFVTGKSPLPLETGIILHTTDGGRNWTTVFQGTISNEYAWKIQRLTPSLYFAALEDFGNVSPQILTSTDGGMSWAIQQVATAPYNIEGIGFLNAQKGWTGGAAGFSFESNDGGITWNTINICPFMNRVFRVNDTMLFASGDRIWKYSANSFTANPPPANRYAWMNCSPNPVSNKLSIDISISVQTRVFLTILDHTGKRVNVIENSDKPKGSYQYKYNTDKLPPGIYYVLLKTHEDKVLKKIIVAR